jgi:hypothetical protein
MPINEFHSHSCLSGTVAASYFDKGYLGRVIVLEAESRLSERSLSGMPWKSNVIME